MKKNVSNVKAQSQTRIRSDIIDIKRKSQTINFSGNVVVEKDDSILLAENMLVVYFENKDAGDSEIKRIEARNNVKIFTEEFIASADFGYFDPSQDIFVLQKNVVVNNGSSIAGGEKFVYNLKTKKGKFVGNKNETSITGNGGDKRVVVVIGEGLKDKKVKNKN